MMYVILAYKTFINLLIQGYIQIFFRQRSVNCSNRIKTLNSLISPKDEAFIRRVKMKAIFIVLVMSGLYAGKIFPKILIITISIC